VGKDTNQTDELRDQPRPELPDDSEPASFETESDDATTSAPAREVGDEDRPQPKLRGAHPTMDEIVKAAREKRDAEEHNEDYKPQSADPEDDAPPIKEPPDELAPVVAKGPSQGPSSHQQPGKSDELEIVVDGERMKIKRSDYPEIDGAPDDVIIRIAQRDKAAEKRLASANTLLKSAKAATTQDPPVHQPGDTTGAAPQVTRPDLAPSEEPTSFDEEKIAEIATKLQVGDATHQGYRQVRDR
jgi:hypothetical protein